MVLWDKKKGADDPWFSSFGEEARYAFWQTFCETPIKACTTVLCVGILPVPVPCQGLCLKCLSYNNLKTDKSSSNHTRFSFFPIIKFSKTIKN
jgi:hypothetical protein